MYFVASLDSLKTESFAFNAIRVKIVRMCVFVRFVLDKVKFQRNKCVFMLFYLYNCMTDC